MGVWDDHHDHHHADDHHPVKLTQASSTVMAVVAPRSEDVEYPSSFFRAYNTRSGEEDYFESENYDDDIESIKEGLKYPFSFCFIYERLRGDITKAFSFMHSRNHLDLYMVMMMKVSWRGERYLAAASWFFILLAILINIRLFGLSGFNSGTVE